MKFMLVILLMVCQGTIVAQDNKGYNIVNIKTIMTESKFKECGLSNLSDEELQNLNMWFTQKIVEALNYGKEIGMQLEQSNTENTPANQGAAQPENQNTSVLYNWNNFHLLEGAWIIANDGQPLGKITAHGFDTDSLTFRFGDYGNHFNTNSIFNKYGTYGNEFSTLSPFNRFTSTPPVIMRDGRILGYLTANKAIASRVDPLELIAWLKSQQ